MQALGSRQLRGFGHEELRHCHDVRRRFFSDKGIEMPSHTARTFCVVAGLVSRPRGAWFSGTASVLRNVWGKE